MDNQPEFFEESALDRTPYGAFVWVTVIVCAFLAAGTYGLWEAAGFVKSQRWLRANRVEGVADTLLDGTQDAATAAMSAADAAARDAAQKAADAAKARATQELLQQKDAVIKQGTDMAEDSIKDAINESADQNLEENRAATEEEIQKYLQP